MGRRLSKIEWEMDERILDIIKEKKFIHRYEIATMIGCDVNTISRRAKELKKEYPQLKSKSAVGYWWQDENC